MPRRLARLLPVALVAALSACAAPGSLTVPDLPTRAADPGPRERLRIVTYNLHWPATAAAARAPALLAELRAADADVIALQELGTWFGDALERSDFARRGGYAAASLGGRTVAPRRLLLLSRFPIRETVVRELPGGSAVLLARLAVNGRTLVVANVHLNSKLERDGLRVAQLREVLALLADEPEAILLGDFNFGDHDLPESAAIPASFRDAWVALRPLDPGLTWNRERNPWARRNSYDGEPSRRLDRVFVRSPMLSPEDAALLGVEPTAGRRHPSDHFGLAVMLRDRAGAPLPVAPAR